MDASMAGSKTKMIKAAARVAAYLLAVTLVFSAISVLCATDTVVFRATEPGVTDLTDFDFNNAVALVATESTNSIFMYPGAFYSPQDFADGSVSVEGVLYGNEGTYNQGEYGTLRMVLMLPRDEVYAIAGKNVSYAQRLFIDGKEYPSIGVPGDSIEAVTPKTTRFTEGFRPAGDTTEIIIHYSAFVYADGGGLYPFDIGLVRNVARNEHLKVFRIAAVSAVLVTAALFFFGLFLFFPKGRYLLWFALICVCVALRGLLTSDKYIMLLLPNLDWYLSIWLEFILTGGMALFAALYLNGPFPHAVNRWAIRGFAGFCVLSMAFLCLTPTVVFSRFTDSFAWVYAVFVSCLLLAVLIAALGQKLTSPLSGAEQILLLFGLIGYVALSVGGIYAHQNSLFLWGLDYPQVGAILFLFLNMLALVLGFARTERELDAARRSEREMEETNRMLARLDRLKDDFLDNISHEMKTPLAVIGNLAGTTLNELRKNALKESAEKRLDTIEDEAVRLGRLVEQLMQVSLEKDRQFTLTNTDAKTVLRRAADYCAPICRIRGNRIAVRTAPEHIPLRVNADGIFRVLINLVTNANRYVENSAISLSAEMKLPAEDGGVSTGYRPAGRRGHTEEGEPGGMVVFTVADSGGGVAPDLLNRVFERGVSGDGGKGLGLSISREIVEEHGGSITIQNIENGARVCFTLPWAEGEETRL